METCENVSKISEKRGENRLKRDDMNIYSEEHTDLASHSSPFQPSDQPFFLQTQHLLSA